MELANIKLPLLSNHDIFGGMIDFKVHLIFLKLPRQLLFYP